MTREHIKYAVGGVLVAIVAAAILITHFMGLSVYVITGASMTGAISKGSLAIDRNVPVGELQVGDVITFRPPNSSDNVTHRIIDIQKDQNGDPVFRTKGDYNKVIDPWQFTLDKPVQARNFFHVPYVGYGLAAFTLRWVRTGILGLVGLLILGLTISWLRREPEDDDLEELTLYRTSGAR
jgi:signal peptidase